MLHVSMLPPPVTVDSIKVMIDGCSAIWNSWAAPQQRWHYDRITRTGGKTYFSRSFRVQNTPFCFWDRCHEFSTIPQSLERSQTFPNGVLIRGWGIFLVLTRQSNFPSFIFKFETFRCRVHQTTWISSVFLFQLPTGEVIKFSVTWRGGV